MFFENEMDSRGGVVVGMNAGCHNVVLTIKNAPIPSHFLCWVIPAAMRVQTMANIHPKEETTTTITIQNRARENVAALRVG